MTPQPMADRQRIIDQRPWKYTGYDGLASFMASDQDFMVLRRFDKLQTRILLHLQAHISIKEKQLQELDDKYRGSSYEIDNGTAIDPAHDRRDLIHECVELMTRYNKLVLQYSDLASRPSAKNRRKRNVQIWFRNNRGAIADIEANFKDEHDLIGIDTTEHSFARHCFESLIVAHTKGVLKCCAKPRKEKDLDHMNNESAYTSDDRILDRIAIFVSFIAGLSFLIIPLWVLWLVKSTRAKLVTVTVCILMVHIFLVTCTVATPSQILAATAAYSAVLVVFLQPTTQ